MNAGNGAIKGPIAGSWKEMPTKGQTIGCPQRKRDKSEHSSANWKICVATIEVVAQNVSNIKKKRATS